MGEDQGTSSCSDEARIGCCLAEFFCDLLTSTTDCKPAAAQQLAADQHLVVRTQIRAHSQLVACHHSHQTKT